MRKLILCMVLLGLLCTPVWAADAFNLKGVTLGMHRQQVEKMMLGTLANDEALADMMLLYEQDEAVFGLDGAKIFYYFTNPEIARTLNFEEDRIYGMGVMFKAYAINDDRAFEDYRRVLAEMKPLYGEPVFSGLMEDGKLDYVCNDENYAGVTQSFTDIMLGRTLWYNDDYYICVDLANNNATGERMMYMSAALAPAGPTWNELTLKE